MSLWLWTASSGCKLHTKTLPYGQSEEVAQPQPTAPTCDGVQNEAQHCAWILIDVKADGIVFLRDLDDEVGVPIH